MKTAEYNKYLSTINSANQCSNERTSRLLLRNIQADLLTRFGMDDADVDRLISQFRYDVLSDYCPL